MLKDSLSKFCQTQIAKIVKSITEERFLKSKDLLWQSMDLDADGEFSYSVKYDLYSGQAGILLFIEQYSEYADDSKYKDIFFKGVEALIHNYDPQVGLGAYLTGSLGIAEFLISKGLKYNQDHWVEKGRSIALIEAPRVRADDFINGHAGRLYALCSIHNMLKDDRLLNQIETAIQILCENAQLWKTGLYWDRDIEQVKGLCGFSHGSGGVGFALMQAGVYLNQPELIELGKKGVDYEEFWFSEKDLNWPDWRKGIYSESEALKYENAFKNGARMEFVRPHDMNAWCHGASGIGMSRIGMKRLLGGTEFDDAIKASISRYSKDILSVPEKSIGIMCHGWLGNMDLILEAQKDGLCANFDALLEKTIESAKSSLDKLGFYLSGYGSKDSSEDCSLFMGNAGIAYQMLRILDPSVPSLLLPANLPPSDVSISENCLKTVREKIQLSELAHSELPMSHQLDFKLQSHLLADMYERKIKLSFGELNDDSVLNHQIRIHPGIGFIETSEGEFKILKSFAMGVKAFEAGQLSVLLLQAFENLKTGDQGVDEIVQQFDPEERNEAKNILQTQLQELCNAGFLIPQELAEKPEICPWE